MMHLWMVTSTSIKFIFLKFAVILHWIILPLWKKQYGSEPELECDHMSFHQLGRVRILLPAVSVTFLTSDTADGGEDEEEAVWLTLAVLALSGCPIFSLWGLVYGFSTSFVVLVKVHLFLNCQQNMNWFTESAGVWNDFSLW